MVRSNDHTRALVRTTRFADPGPVAAVPASALKNCDLLKSIATFTNFDLGPTKSVQLH